MSSNSERLTKQNKGNLCIVMDYADDGELYQWLNNQGARIKEDVILEMFAQVCLAMKYSMILRLCTEILNLKISLKQRLEF